MCFQDNVILMDCVNGLKTIETNSVNIIICDPPYNIGKDFGNNTMKYKIEEYITWCKSWIDECERILTPDGTMFIYGFSEILAYIRPLINYNVRWLVWHYTNKNAPNLNFWQRSHESILCCYREKPNFNRDDIRTDYTDGYKKCHNRVRTNTGTARFGNAETKYNVDERGALPRDVIKCPALSGSYGRCERIKQHPTQKPLQLCETLVKSCMRKSHDNRMVIPFAGTGSECVIAKRYGISFIGFDINQEYVDICNARLCETDQI